MSSCGLMPTLPSALVMDGENYLHPEGPQLDSSLFSVSSSNMEVCYWILFAHIYIACAYSHLNIFPSCIAMLKCIYYIIYTNAIQINFDQSLLY